MRQTEAMVADAPSRRLSYRSLDEHAELEAAAQVVVRVWGEGSSALASAHLLRAYTHFGNPVIGAFDDDRLCGVSIGFLASSGGVHLHSHITGVLPSHQHLGIGFGLKVTQRGWCLENGVDHVTWTFDPLLARNAHFNIRKLGAVSDTLLPDFYGAMTDDLNRGDSSDRLEVFWPIASTRVERAIAAVQSQEGSAGPIDVPSPWGETSEPSTVSKTVALPPDYHALKTADPAEAARWRAQVRDELLDAFASGLHIVDFDRESGYGLAPKARGLDAPDAVTPSDDS